AVIRRSDQRARLDQPPLRGDEGGEGADLPGRVIHARDALVGRVHARLLEEPQVMVVGRAGDLEERGVGVAVLDLEPEEIAVEADAPLHVRHPEHEVLEASEPDAGGGGRHDAAPEASSTLTVIATQAMRLSAPGPRGAPRVPLPLCRAPAPRRSRRRVGAGGARDGPEPGGAGGAGGAGTPRDT